MQSARIDETKLKLYDPSENALPYDPAQAPAHAAAVLENISQAKLLVLIVGSGVQLAGDAQVFREVIERLGIPMTTAWTHDLIASDDEFFCGRPGTIPSLRKTICNRGLDVS